MKKVKKITDLKFSDVDKEDSVYMGDQKVREGKYTYTFESNKSIKHSKEMEVYETVNEAETLKEFRELNNLSKKELVKWLNENYK